MRDFGDHAAVLSHHYDLTAPDELMDREMGLAEFLVPPRSTFIGDLVYPGMRTDSGNLVVAAVHRGGADVPEPTELQAGDSLALRGAWGALDEATEDPDLIAVDDPGTVRRQAVPLGAGAKRAVAVLAGMVLLLGTGIVPAPVAGIVAALAMVLLGVVTVPKALQAVSWTTLILVAGMMSLSAAMVSSGAATMLAEGLVGLLGGAGGYALLGGLFLITAVMGQLISNTATALIVMPIGIAASAQLGVSPVPVLVAIAVFAAGALLTPVATPANLMVMEAGGYRFGDYWKLGLPLLLVYGLLGTFLVPVFWPF